MFTKLRPAFILLILALLALPMVALAQDTPAATIELVGAVEAFDDATLTVNGQVIDITTAEINVALEVELVVEVEALVQPDGSMVATEVNASDSLPGEIEVIGLLTSLDAATAEVAGMTFDVASAEIKDGVAVDQLVKVHATLSETGTWVAREIELADEPLPDTAPEPDDDADQGEFEITGTLEAVGDASIVVAGMTIDITNAEIHDPLVVGALVKVHVTMVDGALVAREVENAFDDDTDDEADEVDDDGEDSDEDESCTPGQPSGWTTYVVQPGDTLESLAAILGIDDDDLAEANCLDDDSNLVPGSTLYGPAPGQGDDSVDHDDDSGVSDDQDDDQGDDSSDDSADDDHDDDSDDDSQDDDSDDDSADDHGDDSGDDSEDD